MFAKPIFDTGLDVVTHINVFFYLNSGQHSRGYMVSDTKFYYRWDRLVVILVESYAKGIEHVKTEA